jgi:predicted Zn-dependent protease
MHKFLKNAFKMKNYIKFQLRVNKQKLTAIFLILLSVSLSLLYSCGANLFSTKEDVDLGQQLDQEIKANPREYPMLQGNEAVTSYVSNLGKYIINNSTLIQYKNIFPYNFQVINDTIVNAFSTPGGFIYVYTGLMKFIDNEATLTGIMAHEIAHAERRHMTQRLTSYYGVSFVLSLLLGNNPNAFAEIAANLFVGIGFLANSRSDEEEADNYSIRYLMTTDYYPGAIKYFFTKIVNEQRIAGTTPGGLDRLLSTHPLPQDRIDNVKKQLIELKINSDSTKGQNIERYNEIKSKLL